MSTQRETAYSIAVAALFFLVRLPLLVVRESFYDELFTVWMAGRPLTRILPSLLLDSGPPLYYFVARIPDVTALRVLSLIFATGTLVLILTRKSLGEMRFAAALLLAVYPPAALFAVDARAYALCGLFLTTGILAVHEKKPFVAAAALLLAAYTHWYGALFLPLVLLTMGSRRGLSAVGDRLSEAERERRQPTTDNRQLSPPLRGVAPARALTAMVIASILFLPGLWLAWRQPAEAIAWMPDSSLLPRVAGFGFAGDYPASLFASAPLVLIIFATVAVFAAAARSFALAPMLLVPLLLAAAFALAGRNVYFPMRFESVTAVPLVLWLGSSLQQWSRVPRSILLAILAACGLATIAIGVQEHANRPLDPFREAALTLRRNLAPGERVVATGYLYLETVHQLGEQRVTAWPAEQGRHPGWRVAKTSEPPPREPFLWIGERHAPELAALRSRKPHVLFANEGAVILRVP